MGRQHGLDHRVNDPIEVLCSSVCRCLSNHSLTPVTVTSPAACIAAFLALSCPAPVRNANPAEPSAQVSISISVYRPVQPPSPAVAVVVASLESAAPRLLSTDLCRVAAGVSRRAVAQPRRVRLTYRRQPARNVPYRCQTFLFLRRQMRIIKMLELLNFCLGLGDR